MKSLPTSASLAPLVLVMGLVACGGKSEPELLASADAFAKKGELSSASIELKSALQRNPNSAVARFQLGDVLLKMGNAEGAEIELRKARDLGHPGPVVAPALAKAMVARGQFKQALAEFSNVTPPDGQQFADLQTTLGVAAAKLGDRPRTDAAIQAALSKVPSYAPALLLKARIVAGAGDVPSALALTDQIVGADPKNAEAWQLRGDLHLLGKRDRAAAVEDYRKVVALRPTEASAHAILIEIFFGQNDLQAAKTQFEAMKSAQPNHAVTRFTEAQLALASGDLSRSGELVDQLLRSAPDNVRVLQLAALIALQRNALASAEAHLNKALTLAPDLLRPRALLAQTYLRSGQPAKAIEVLKPALERGTDLEAMTLAAEAYLQQGDSAESEAYFKRAAKLSPDDPKVRTALALTHLARGQVDVAFSELRRIAESDKGTLAELTLISAHLRRGEADAALKVIDTLEQKTPGQALAPNLRGQVLLQKKDAAGARKSFEAALSRDPAYFPAVSSLAALDAREGRPAEAGQRFESVIKANPRNVQALVALAELRAKTGATKEDVASILERAIAADPASPIPRALLVDHWLGHGASKQALSIAQTAAAALPESLEVLDALGRAQMAAGDINQAIQTFGKAAGLHPKASLPHLRLADAHLLAKNLQASEASLRRAIDLAPGLLRAQRGLIALTLQMKRPQAALQIAREVQKQRPDEAIGWVFEADVHAHARNWPAALTVLRQAQSKRNPGALASRLYYALVALKKTPEAEAFAAEWLAKNPNDLEFAAYLGDAAMARREYPLAESRFRAVLKLAPGDVGAKNNLAWLLVKQQKPGGVELAREAAKAMPDNPAVLDTLSLALEAENKLPEAVEVGRRARELAPQVTGYRLHLAKLYIRTGDKAAAKAELEPLVKLGDKLREQSEVAQLMNGL